MTLNLIMENNYANLFYLISLNTRLTGFCGTEQVLWHQTVECDEKEQKNNVVIYSVVKLK